jgi:hypothetical protein
MRENLSESQALRDRSMSGHMKPMEEPAAPTRADVSSASVGTAVIEVKELPRCYPQHVHASAGVVGRCTRL